MSTSEAYDIFAAAFKDAIEAVGGIYQTEWDVVRAIPAGSWDTFIETLQARLPRDWRCCTRAASWGDRDYTVVLPPLHVQIVFRAKPAGHDGCTMIGFEFVGDSF